jgi:hypothetical protein
MKVEMDVIGSVLKIGDLYLDPGSGSYIIQILLAALLGGAFAIKMYWRKIKSFFVKTPPMDTEDDLDDLDKK